MTKTAQSPNYQQVPDYSVVTCNPTTNKQPIVEGYVTNWLVYNQGLPTAFPGYGPIDGDKPGSPLQLNTKDVDTLLPYMNNIVYSFLEVKQNEDPNIDSYTNNESYLGNAMFIDPWSDFKKPTHPYQWAANPAEQYPAIGWMNDHLEYFVEKARTGAVFDPQNENFPYDFLNYGNFDAFVAYKQGQSDEPKKIIGIGGYGDQYLTGWNAAVNHPERFAHSIIDIAQHFDLDGVDLDWEPLSQISGQGHTANDMISLAQSIKLAANNAGMHDFIIGFPITVNVDEITEFNDSIAGKDAWVKLMTYVDHVSIMGYDMHGAFDNPKLTGLHSALYPVPCDENAFSINSSVEALRSFGVPYEQMVLGIATYARTVNGVSENGLGRPFQGAYRGDFDVPTGTPTGIMSYKGLIDKVPANSIYDVTSNNSETGNVPVIIGSYAYLHDKLFGSFDTTDSVKAKVDYAQDHNFAGVMAWSIETDAPAGKGSIFETMWNGYDL